MAFDFGSLMGMLGGMGGANANPGTLMSVLGMGNVANPAMTGASTGMMPPGMMPPGMGNDPSVAFPGATSQMPGQGVQMPGAPGQGGQTPMASAMANMMPAMRSGDPMNSAMLQAGPKMMDAQARQQQLQQMQMMQPGQLPIAGAMGAMNRRAPMQGYMASGGGIAPQRIMRI